ncbi:MAG: hypothetical protein HKP53_09515 [Eudoraea sp.]|nr:hypothetical protein [Eudoraea sp.]
MKRSVTLLLILMTCLPWAVRPQEEKGGESETNFYGNMAITDALKEQSLAFVLEEDEMDYWKDQRNFEKSLKQENYTAYKTYIFFKRRSYLEHEQGCDIASEHGKGYNKQASFYTIQGKIALTGTKKVVENFRLTEETIASQH